MQRLVLLVGAGQRGNIAIEAASALAGLCDRHLCAREELRTVSAVARPRIEALHRAHASAAPVVSKLLAVLDTPREALNLDPPSAAVFRRVLEDAVAQGVLTQKRMDKATQDLTAYVDAEARERAIYRMLLSPPFFANGARVKLADLASRPELNDESGVIAGCYHRGADGSVRLPVKLTRSNGGGPMAVRPGNLRLVQQSTWPDRLHGDAVDDSGDFYAEPIRDPGLR
eukprot:3034022-Rhodomonas_salina.1